jgi:hypothetical protein
MALTDSLDELITSGAITPQLAMKVLQQVCLAVISSAVWGGVPCGRVLVGEDLSFYVDAVEMNADAWEF